MTSRAVTRRQLPPQIKKYRGGRPPDRQNRCAVSGYGRHWGQPADREAPAGSPPLRDREGGPRRARGDRRRRGQRAVRSAVNGDRRAGVRRLHRGPPQAPRNRHCRSSTYDLATAARAARRACRCSGSRRRTSTRWWPISSRRHHDRQGPHPAAVVGGRRSTRSSRPSIRCSPTPSSRVSWRATSPRTSTGSRTAHKDRRHLHRGTRSERCSLRSPTTDSGTRGSWRCRVCGAARLPVCGGRTSTSTAKTLSIANNRVIGRRPDGGERSRSRPTSRRTLPLPDRLVSVLRAAKTRQAAERLALGARRPFGSTW